ncbi:MAG: septation protein A [Neisseriales bacterium]|nr:MAG: septation protein A [Neisseriales bacterium]
MKLFFDFIPIILFFTVYWFSNNIFLATQMLMAMMAMQVLYSFLRYKKISATQWISLLLVIVLGGATLYFHNNRFIMWKPTLLYWAISCALLVGMYFKKNGIRYLLGKELQLSEVIWVKLNIAWVIFFLLLGALNLAVAYFCSEAIWVNFKVFGCLGLVICFIFIQGIILFRK